MPPGAIDPVCFECVAKDGVRVRLTKARYNSHILDEHPDLANDFAYPEIGRAHV